MEWKAHQSKIFLKPLNINPKVSILNNEGIILVQNFIFQQKILTIENVVSEKQLLLTNKLLCNDSKTFDFHLPPAVGKELITTQPFIDAFKLPFTFSFFNCHKSHFYCTEFLVIAATPCHHHVLLGYYRLLLIKKGQEGLLTS